MGILGGVRSAIHSAGQYRKAAREIQALHKVQAIIEFQLDGTIIEANDNFLGVMGFSRSEVIGRHHSLFVDEALRKSEEYRQFWQGLARGGRQSGLYRRIARDGRDVWIQGSYSPVFNVFGRPVRVIKHAIDVSKERLEAADMQGRLAAIDRAQAVITFDLNGQVLDANDNFLNALGYNRGEVIGRHHRLFVEPAERGSEAYRQFWHRLQRGEYHSGLFRRIRKNGDDIWIQATYNPIFDLSGRPIKIVKYATDVSRQTKASQELQKSLESLAETVPAIAGRAQNANHLAQDASHSADSGGLMVQELVSTIADLNHRAQSMAEIVGLIDSIALQTKLLSLNAAVEAARAGKQGQSFAVVAQEIRALAQRCADSSKDIRALVSSTIDSLTAGSDRAKQAGGAMHSIVGSITEVNGRISDIAQAADEQARGIAQVTASLSHLKVADNRC